MEQLWKKYGWLICTLAGSFIFALGFDYFLAPNDLNSGGISGLAMVIVELIGFGSVGTLSMLINLPLFVIGGMKIGRRFFVGSIIGLVTSSVLIDAMVGLAMPQSEPLLGALYGGAVCGIGLGLVFIAGTSTGGSDIVVRLLKLKYRNVPIGQISMSFDLIVVILTGIVFHDITKAMYTGVTVFITGKVIDAMVYGFDYSKVALIISDKHDEIARQIGTRLSRGSTFLHGEGTYSGKEKKVVLAAIKRQQLAELKELVIAIDPDAFIIVQEAHQVLGDGFIRYSKDSL